VRAKNVLMAMIVPTTPATSQISQGALLCDRSISEILIMTISYRESLEIIHRVAERCCAEGGKPTEMVPLLEALGRIAAKDHTSPIQTPPNDTSAMDGFAVSSRATAGATSDEPVAFILKGTLAAGDSPITLANEPENGAYPCVEIMTGAQFPVSTSAMPFDACVKIEDTISLGSFVVPTDSKPRAHISVKKPLSTFENRRFAGSDMKEKDIILAAGQVVCARHVMALASVGITEVTARRKLRVAVWSTGNELSEGSKADRRDSQIFNSNGPYLSAALLELGVHVEYKGILRDDQSSLDVALRSVGSDVCDLVVTTGAVSKGKYDFILPALEELRADIHFHGVAIRPGHPVLFATTKFGTRDIPMFGLPGNPIATAACFRFLVVPFLRMVLGQEVERPETVEILSSSHSPTLPFKSPSHLDCFRHGDVKMDVKNRKVVVLSDNQSPAVISHFAGSNCWVHIPCERAREHDSSVVYCYPHNSLSD
jgi:molybdopterin molybdotransferase